MNTRAEPAGGGSTFAAPPAGPVAGYGDAGTTRGQDDGRGPECGTECARVSRWSRRARVRLRRWILAVVTVVVVAGGITIAVNCERLAIALWPTWHLIELEKGGGGWPTWATRVLDTRLNAALAREAYPIERRHCYTDRALRKSEPPAWAGTYQGGTIIDVGEFVLASGEGFVLRRHLVVQWDHPENHGGFSYNDDGILIDREFFARRRPLRHGQSHCRHAATSCSPVLLSHRRPESAGNSPRAPAQSPPASAATAANSPVCRRSAPPERRDNFGRAHRTPAVDGLRLMCNPTANRPIEATPRRPDQRRLPVESGGRDARPTRAMDFDRKLDRAPGRGQG